MTCLLHLGGTFLVHMRFFECLSFICVTSPDTLAMIDVGNNCHIFGNSKGLESKETGRDFSKNEANFSEISAFGNNMIPDDFFDDWSFLNQKMMMILLRK